MMATIAGSTFGGCAWRPSEKSLFNIAKSNRSYRSLRDGSFSYSIPGSKLPGYYHSVPTGQKPPATCPQDRSHITKIFGGEDDYD
jgi:hypothetical protein